MVKRSKAGALEQHPSPPKKALHTAQTHTPPACSAYLTTTETLGSLYRLWIMRSTNLITSMSRALKDLRQRGHEQDHGLRPILVTVGGGGGGLQVSGVCKFLLTSCFRSRAVLEF
jgi:hypothetical protein